MYAEFVLEHGSNKAQSLQARWRHFNRMSMCSYFFTLPLQVQFTPRNELTGDGRGHQN